MEMYPMGDSVKSQGCHTSGNCMKCQEFLVCVKKKDRNSNVWNVRNFENQRVFPY